MDFPHFFEKFFLKKCFSKLVNFKIVLPKFRYCIYIYISSDPKIWIHPKSLSCFFSILTSRATCYPFLGLGRWETEIRQEDGRDWQKHFGTKFGQYCRILHKSIWSHTSNIEWDMFKWLFPFFLPTVKVKKMFKIFSQKSWIF